jgi:hypothetical protein
LAAHRALVPGAAARAALLAGCFQQPVGIALSLSYLWVPSGVSVGLAPSGAHHKGNYAVVNPQGPIKVTELTAY